MLLNGKYFFVDGWKKALYRLTVPQLYEISFHRARGAAAGRGGVMKDYGTLDSIQY
jgi:hypothetical protein